MVPILRKPKPKTAVCASCLNAKQVSRNSLKGKKRSNVIFDLPKGPNDAKSVRVSVPSQKDIKFESIGTNHHLHIPGCKKTRTAGRKSAPKRRSRSAKGCKKSKTVKKCRKTRSRARGTKSKCRAKSRKQPCRRTKSTRAKCGKKTTPKKKTRSCGKRSKSIGRKSRCQSVKKSCARSKAPSTKRSSTQSKTPKRSTVASRSKSVKKSSARTQLKRPRSSARKESENVKAVSNVSGDNLEPPKKRGRPSKSKVQVLHPAAVVQSSPENDSK